MVKEWASRIEQSFMDSGDDDPELLTNVTAIDNLNDDDNEANNSGSLFTHAGLYMTGFCVSLREWCGKLFSPRPSRLSSHPP